MDREMFEMGETLEAFVASMEDSVREKFTLLLDESRQALNEGNAPSSALPAGLRVVVIAEPWSGDVLYNLPVLAALAEAARWDMRIFRRDEHPNLIERYKKEGIYQSIPVFIFFDEEFNELNHWIERPQIATETIDRESLNLRRRLRETHKDEWREATIGELIGLFAD